MSRAYSTQPRMVWCVAGGSHFQKAQQVSVISLNANAGIKILWVPGTELCTCCSRTKTTNNSDIIDKQQYPISLDRDREVSYAILIYMLCFSLLLLNN